MVGYSQSSEKVAALVSDTYDPPLGSNRSLDKAMEKVFDDSKLELYEFI